MNQTFNDNDPEIWAQAHQNLETAQAHYNRIIQPFIERIHYDKANPDTIIGSQPINDMSLQAKILTRKLLITRRHLDQMPRDQLSHLTVYALNEIAEARTTQTTQYTITRNPTENGTTLHIYAGTIPIGTTQTHHDDPTTELDTVLDYLNLIGHTVNPNNIHFTDNKPHPPSTTSSTSTTEEPEEPAALRAAISPKISSN